MYFLSLRNFNANRGPITDNHGKFPLLTSDKGVFEPDSYPVETPWAHFQHIEKGGHVYYVSEPNILKVYNNSYFNQKTIIVDYAYKIDAEQTDKILQDFFDGYRAGIGELFKELGQSFFSLGLGQRKEILQGFISYSKQMLYFEGFAIPELMHTLGYIQATLVQAVKEYRNIKDLKETPLALPEIIINPTFQVTSDAFAKEPVNEAKILHPHSASAEEIVPQPSAPTNQPNPSSGKLSLSCQEEEITSLWFILADQTFCNANGLPKAFESEKDVLKLLGTLFLFPSTENPKVIPGAYRYYQLSPFYQQLLCVLMHATYKINQRYDRLTLKPFCELLKKSFSPFETIEEVQDICSNITKKAEIVTPLIAKSDGEYAKKTCTILAKLAIYKLKN